MNDIVSLIPRDKCDDSNIHKLREIDSNEAMPILGSLLEWIQDINWPIAQKLITVLPRFHKELIPYIKTAFESDDAIWKCYILCMLKEFPVDSILLLHSEIIRIAQLPTKSELEEGANEHALEVIDKFKLKIKDSF